MMYFVISAMKALVDMDGHGSEACRSHPVVTEQLFDRTIERAYAAIQCAAQCARQAQEVIDGNCIEGALTGLYTLEAGAVELRKSG
ncbi:hypothetical protein JZ751_020295 [Albula glossodonta]|uniref:Uncharacterized protein n=1 Tax=Albula glossodonta TaxID=121402 RepID=A0A8T2NK03_9TELE|nr:hypothetical protein JZ751_020295 [Albula glossodonta]